MANEWGPLGPLVGEWQEEGGLDTAYSHSEHTVLATPYLEKLTFKPFGPVQNGRQCLYGLDCKSGITVLAGGTADAGATSFTLNAKAGDPQYSIGGNRYLVRRAARAHGSQHPAPGRLSRSAER